MLAELAPLHTPAASAACAAEQQRIAALEAANALLNATVYAQAEEIAALRRQLRGLRRPPQHIGCCVEISRASVHTESISCARARAGARLHGALPSSGSTGTAAMPVPATAAAKTRSLLQTQGRLRACALGTYRPLCCVRSGAAWAGL